jgi:heptosyltransferase-1
MAPERPENVNILIVKLSSIGDVIHTLPALAALRRCYPDADITWVVEEAAADLLTGHPDLDRVLVSRRKTWIRDFRQGRIAAPLREMRALLRELRSRPYDLVIDFHGLFKSAVIVLVSGGKRKLGYDSMQEGSGLFYNEKIPEAMEKHAVDRYLDFVRYLAGDGIEASCLAAAPEFTIAAGEKGLRQRTSLQDEHSAIIEAVESRGNGMKSGGGRKPETRFVAVNPVALWETKLWEDNKFAELCDRVRQELGIGVILTGSEAGPLDRICAQMKTAAVNLGGRTTLRELACLYSDASLVITTDSGPMHLAAAVGTPVVGRLGPGHRIIRCGLSCSPCFRKHCKAPRCMTEISVEDVFATVKEVL